MESIKSRNKKSIYTANNQSYSIVIKTYILPVLLLFVSFWANGQTQDLKITAEYISENKVSVKIENLTNDTVSMLISPDMGFSWSGMMLTFMKNKKDTVDHYFEPLYDKYLLYIPPHLIHERIFFIGSEKKETNLSIDIILRYVVCSKPSRSNHIWKEIKLEWNKNPQNKTLNRKP